MPTMIRYLDHCASAALRWSRSSCLGRTSVESVELNPPAQHTSQDNYSWTIVELRKRSGQGIGSWTTVTVSFRDITGMKPFPNLSPNQLALRTAYGTKTTLIHKELTSLMRCPAFVLLTSL
ncbi:hypothetical protein TNCV_4473481 [Trichonephila clavipes]|nr:hypothetical protein TNCV_4473481 [Trichonephila clavipes]